MTIPILLVLWLALPPSSHAQTAVPDELSSRLQGSLDEWAESDLHYGVSAAVILDDGREWTGSAGIETPGGPLESNRLIWIASITKTMTGAVILRLADRGRLALDDPISKWLPGFENVDGDITLRQLLNHTNGLANYTNNQEFLARIGADPDHVFTPSELLSYVGPPEFVPGTRTQYTNTSFVLLGLIAEHVTGTSIVDLYHEELWEPLGLDQIFLPLIEKPPAPVAAAWRVTRTSTTQVEPLEQTSLLAIGSYAFGLFADASTVARWGRALFAGDVLSEEMKGEMLEFVPAAGNIPGESGAGLGIRKYDFNDGVQWGHSGGSPFGSSLLVYDPATGITVAVLMNQGARSDHFRLAPELLQLASSAAAPPASSETGH